MNRAYGSTLLFVAAMGCSAGSPGEPEEHVPLVCEEEVGAEHAPKGEWRGVSRSPAGAEEEVHLMVLDELSAAESTLALVYIKHAQKVYLIHGRVGELRFHGVAIFCEADPGCVYDPSETNFDNDLFRYNIPRSIDKGTVVILGDTYDGTCPEAEDTYGLWAVWATLQPSEHDGQMRLAGEVEVGVGCPDTVPEQVLSWEADYRGWRAPR